MSDLRTYRNMLRINKHRLDDELEIQREIQDRIGTEVTRTAAKLADAQEKLETHEAELLLDLRDSAEKITNDEIKAKIQVNRERRGLVGEVHRLKAELSEWEKLLKAWEGRGFDLRALGDLHASQYFIIDSAYKRRDDRPTDEQVHQRRAEMRSAGRTSLLDAPKTEEPEVPRRARRQPT